MNSKIKDGGPAFHSITVGQEGDPAYNPPTKYYHRGMSLRDYFAAQAMVGWLATFGNEDGHPCGNGGDGHQIAAESYRLADAMLKARNE